MTKKPKAIIAKAFGVNLILLICFLNTNVYSQVEVVDVGVEAGVGEITVMVEATGPLSYDSFTLSRPSLLVVDIAEATLKEPVRRDIKSKIASRIICYQYSPDTVRLVVALGQLIETKVSVKENVLSLELSLPREMKAKLRREKKARERELEAQRRQEARLLAAREKAEEKAKKEEERRLERKRKLKEKAKREEERKLEKERKLKEKQLLDAKETEEREKRKQEREAAKQKKIEEKQRLAQEREEERVRLIQEREETKQLEIQRRKEERAKAEAKKEEERRLRAEEKARLRAEKEEAKKLAEQKKAEEKAREEEEKAKREEERRLEREKKLKERELLARKRAGEKAKLEVKREAQLRLAAEAGAEKLALKRAKEKAKKEQGRLSEERRKEEEARIAKEREVEAEKRAEEEAKLRAEREEERRLERERKLKEREVEAEKRAEEEAKLRAEREVRRLEAEIRAKELEEKARERAAEKAIRGITQKVGKKAKFEVRELVEEMELAERQAAREIRERERKIERHLSQGQSYYQDSQFQRAAKEFEEVLTLDPQNKWAKGYLARAEKGAREEEARQSRRQKEREKQEKINKHIIQGKNYYKEGRFSEAIAEWEKVLPLITIPSDARGKLTRELIHRARLAKTEMERKDVAGRRGTEREESFLAVDKGWLPTEKQRGRGKVVGAAKPRGEETEAKMRLKEKGMKPVTLDFDEAPLRDVLRYLAEIGEVNIVLDEAVFSTGGEIDEEVISPEVTTHLKDIPLIEALEVIVRTKGLKYRLEENLIWITTPETMGAEEMVTKVYHLSSGISGLVEFERPEGFGEEEEEE